MKKPLTETELTTRRIKKDYPIRGDYFRDQTAIIHSMPFRRLKHKTQVFFAPENDHVCTRIEHVLHVATVACSICRGLKQKGWALDEELAFAIGIGHDIGHTPFGHAGEEIITEILKEYKVKDKFIHEVNGYRVVEYLANKGEGLNLTYAVKDGIISHNGEKHEQSIRPDYQLKDLDKVKDRKIYPSTYEGCIVRFADTISYLGRDIEDAIIAGIFDGSEIPEDAKKIVGNDFEHINGHIIDYLIKDIIENSIKDGPLSFSNEAFEILRQLRDFSNNKIYNCEEILEYKIYGKNILKILFSYLKNLYDYNGKKYDVYEKSTKKLDRHFGEYIKKMANLYSKEGDQPVRITVDYVAGMTDNYALACMEEISIPKPIQFPKKIS